MFTLYLIIIFVQFRLFCVFAQNECLPELICNDCNCFQTNKSISCNKYKGDWESAIEKSRTCEYRNIKIVDRNLTLPWRSVTSKTSLLEILDLGNSTLNCYDCNNAWFAFWDKLQPTSQACTTCPNLLLRQIARFPNTIYWPNNLFSHCSYKNAQTFFTKHCNLNYPPIDMKISQNEISCKSAVPDNCIELTFVSIFKTFGTTSRFSNFSKIKTCDNSGVLRIENSQTKDSGWLVCTINTGLLPAARIVPVFKRGKPAIIYWNKTVTHSERIFHYVVVAAEYLGDVNLELWYNPDDGNETIYQIRPHPKHERLFEWIESSYEIEVEEWTIKQLEMIFHNPVQQCMLHGVYKLKVCNSYGCDSRGFTIMKTPWPCRAVEEKFLIVNATVSDNLVIPFADEGIGSPENSPSERQDDLSEINLRQIVLLTLAGVVIIVIGIIVIILWHRQKQSKKEENHKAQSDDIPLNERPRDGNNPRTSLLLHENPTYMDWCGTIKLRKEIPVIATEDFAIIKELGEGAFGKVHLICYKPPKNANNTVEQLLTPSTSCTDLVSQKSSNNSQDRNAPESGQLLAIKQLKFVTYDKLSSLEREAIVLMKLQHRNIVHFYGITVQCDGFALVFEYMNHGDLVTFLRDRNPDLQEYIEEPLHIRHLLRVAVQVATALEYLASHYLVHRDIAARNCLVGDNLQIKLSDFGMTRDVYISDYYKMDSHTIVPLRWLPPESIIYRKFTTESDVWSFGVLLWEIFSYGQVPWYIYSNSEVLDIVKSGRLLIKPDQCPENLYNRLILPCWLSHPSDRVTAKEAKENIEHILEDSFLYCQVN